jgi:hypothetical protein
MAADATWERLLIFGKDFHSLYLPASLFCDFWLLIVKSIRIEVPETGIFFAFNNPRLNIRDFPRFFAKPLEKRFSESVYIEFAGAICAIWVKM